MVLGGASPWDQPRTPVLTRDALEVTGLSAADCGVCHTAIYKEWKTSIHAAAWTDPQFQAELHKDPEVAWLCLNCHTPVANQQPHLVTPNQPLRGSVMPVNPAFDEVLRSEGVTCLSCHWTPDGIAAPHEGVRAPHATVYTPGLTSDALCASCHQAKARLEDALVCHFNTGQEKQQAGVTQSCTDCHMPSVERPVVAGGAVRTGGRHTWPGSGLGKGTVPAVTALESLKLLDVTAERSGAAVTRLSFVLNNAGAGHMVPTGDPERFLRITASLLGADGSVRDSRQWRIGQMWTWSPVAEKTSDNRLGVGERRAFSWETASAGVEIFLSIEHVRLSQENLEYHLDLIASGHPGPTRASLLSYPTKRTVIAQRVSIR